MNVQFLATVFVVTGICASTSLADEVESKIAHIGRLYTGSALTVPRGFAAFAERLGELGWIEGRNLLIESRWAEGHDERLPSLARELVERKVDVIVVAGTASALAAKEATNSIPIVAAAMGDPVASGLANTLARPGSNVTGLSVQQTEGMPGKWLELLKETIPRVRTVAVILGANNPLARIYEKQFPAVARIHGMRVRISRVDQQDALDKLFREARGHAQAAVVLPDTFTMYHRKYITSLALKYGVPVIYGILDFVDAGGWMAYGVDQSALYGAAAVYVDKILRGGVL